MSKSNAEKQRDFYNRQKQRGLKAVTVYVPVDKVNKLRHLAKKLTEEHVTPV